MSWQPLRFGVIGLGAHGETVLACLRGLRSVTGLEVTAICSHSAERAQALARQYEVPRWYTDVDAFAQDPALDCLAAGKEVIVEKPLATRLEDADAMISAAQRAGKHLMVAQILRFDVAYAVLAERIARGELGQLALLHTRRNRPAQATSRYRRTHPLLETGILDTDVMLWLTGSRVRRVRAYTRTVQAGFSTPDVALGLLEFESGVIGCLETCWVAPDRAGIFTDDALSVVGSRGTARLDLSRAPVAVWTEEGYSLPDLFYEAPVGGAPTGALREELLYFIGCLRAGRPPDRVPLDQVRHGLEVVLALIQSAEEDQEIAL